MRGNYKTKYKASAKRKINYFEESIELVSEVSKNVKNYIIEKCRNIPAYPCTFFGTAGILYCADQLKGVVSPISCFVWVTFFATLVIVGCISNYAQTVDEIRSRKREERKAARRAAREQELEDLEELFLD